MTHSELPFLTRMRQHGEARAIHKANKNYSYNLICNNARLQALSLLALTDSTDLNEGRVALLLSSAVDFTQSLFAVWQAGGIAVPLSLTASEPELEYLLKNSGADFVMVSESLKERISTICSELGAKLIIITENTTAKTDESATLPFIDQRRRAIIIYTSGTTSRPKGVVLNHYCVQARIEVLIQAWEWSRADSIPLFLPRHHIHGLFNILLCGLWAGASIETFDRFDIKPLIKQVATGAYSLFMAVPTIYVKLIQYLGALAEPEKQEILNGFRSMRLMISGSSPLPKSTFVKWQQLTGQTLLERYGLTETGMCISNPLNGERRPAQVGQPLSSVKVQLVDEQGQVIKEDGGGHSGEIQIAGPSVFQEYWNQTEVTRSSFHNEWFSTGDMGQIENGYYRILGRLSTDIIKTAGYKVSALEIEVLLMESPLIDECAVVALPDAVYGEIIAAAIIPANSNQWNQKDIEELCRTQLSPYKCPKRWQLLKQLPRNAMGKVVKPQIQKMFADDKDSL